MEKLLKYRLLSIIFNLTPVLRRSFSSTEANSTQPRGSTIGNGNAQKFSLAPIIDRFRTPARTVTLKSTGENNHYFDWAGSIITNSMCDPFLLSAWMTSHELIYAYINDIPGAPGIQRVMYASPGKSNPWG